MTPRQRHRDLSQASQKVLSAVAEPSADKPFLHPKHLLITVSQDESPASGGLFFRAEKTYITYMNLQQLITPKREDGGIDHRYQSIIKDVIDLAGDRCVDLLVSFYEKTSQLEKDHAGAALHLVRKSFEVEMDEFQRKRVTKQLTTALKELGFKPSKVSKLINAGRFIQTLNHIDEGWCYFGRNVWMTGPEIVDKVSEYFEGFGVGSLDVLSRITKQGRKKAHRHFVKQGARMSQSALEELQRHYPANPNERRGRKPDRANFPEARPTYALATHESLAVMDDADEWEGESTVEQPTSGQLLIAEFFRLFKTGELSSCLDEFTPSAQAHLIEEIRSGIPLLEEFVAKNSTIDVVSTH